MTPQFGLAELDGWNAKLAGYRSAATLLRGIDAPAGSLVTAPDIASCYALHVRCVTRRRTGLAAEAYVCTHWFAPVVWKRCAQAPLYRKLRT